MAFEETNNYDGILTALPNFRLDDEPHLSCYQKYVQQVCSSKNEEAERDTSSFLWESTPHRFASY